MQIIDRIAGEISKKKISVLKLSNETGISAYKIYKWLDKKGSPKHEDSIKLEKWLKNDLEIVPHETAADAIITQGNTVYIIELKEQIKELKDDKVFIKKQFEERLQSLETNLEKALSNQEELTMQLRAGLMYLAEHFAGDDPKKKAKEKEHIDKLIAAGRK